MYKFPLKEDISQITAIIEAAGAVWGIHPKNILGRGREQPRAIVRQICMALSYRMTSLTLAEVAHCFNLIDHATVIHAIKRVDKAANDPELAPKIAEVIRKSPPPYMGKKEKAKRGEGALQLST